MPTGINGLRIKSCTKRIGKHEENTENSLTKSVGELPTWNWKSNRIGKVLTLGINSKTSEGVDDNNKVYWIHNTIGYIITAKQLVTENQ